MTTSTKLTDRELNSYINRLTTSAGFEPSHVVNSVVSDLESDYLRSLGAEEYDKIFPKGLSFAKYKTRSILEAICARLIKEDPKADKIWQKCRNAVLRSSEYRRWKEEQDEIIKNGGAEFSRVRVFRSFSSSGGMVD